MRLIVPLLPYQEGCMRLIASLPSPTVKRVMEERLRPISSPTVKRVVKGARDLAQQ